MKSSRPLSGKRLRLLQIVAEHKERESFPLVGELAQEMGLAGRTSIVRMLEALTGEGFLEKQGGGSSRNRCIYLPTAAGYQALDSANGIALNRTVARPQLKKSAVPIGSLAPPYLAPPAPVVQSLRLPVVGQITAGPLNEVLEYPETMVEPGDGLQARETDFFLEVSGDSMVGDGILSGDLVLIRPGVQVANGGIAAVQLIHEDGVFESTLKHIYFGQKGTVTLRASNPIYEDMILPADRVQVAGAYRGLLRIVR